MPFPLNEAYLAVAEQALGATLPADYRAAIAKSNGGEIEAADEAWQLLPLEDRSDNKRIARTTNHALRETEEAKKWPSFPSNALCIASNGTGDFLVLLRQEGSFGSAVYLWSHEERTVQRVAESFAELSPTR